LKKILASLSLFLLTGTSLANVFEPIGNPWGIYSSIVFFIIFLIIFIVSVIYTQKTGCSMIVSDNMKEKKQLTKKSLIFLISSLGFLLIGSNVLSVLFTFATGSIRVPNYIDFVFNILCWIVFVSLIILGIITELVKSNKISNSKIMNIICILSIVLVSILSIILIVGLLRGEYSNTTYYWG